jgi:hypothetical protein
MPIRTASKPKFPVSDSPFPQTLPNPKVQVVPPVPNDTRCAPDPIGLATNPRLDLLPLVRSEFPCGFLMVREIISDCLTRRVAIFRMARSSMSYRFPLRARYALPTVRRMTSDRSLGDFRSTVRRVISISRAIYSRSCALRFPVTRPTARRTVRR